MGHIEREGDVLGEHLVNALDHVFGRTCLVACAPLVEPSAPELRAHLRCVGAQFAETTELLVDVCPGTEVHRPHQVVESVLGEVAGPVTLEEHRADLPPLLVLGVPVFFQQVADSADIWLVFAVAAILVLYLHHDDRSAALYGQRGELPGHLFLKHLHALHEVRILLTQTDVLLL